MENSAVIFKDSFFPSLLFLAKSISSLNFNYQFFFFLYSDGVADVKRSLFQIIQDCVENKVSDEDLANAPIKYPHLTPTTKESYYYRFV